MQERVEPHLGEWRRIRRRRRRSRRAVPVRTCRTWGTAPIVSAPPPRPPPPPRLPFTRFSPHRKSSTSLAPPVIRTAAAAAASTQETNRQVTPKNPQEARGRSRNTSSPVAKDPTNQERQEPRPGHRTEQPQRGGV
jgi:hypothetical protein